MSQKQAHLFACLLCPSATTWWTRVPVQTSDMSWHANFGGKGLTLLTPAMYHGCNVETQATLTLLLMPTLS